MRIDKLPDDDSGCGWYNILPEPPPARRLSGGQRAKWVVLGAGFTGLAAARRLAEALPGEEIFLIEAGRVGHGASGRNSGFVIDLPHNVGPADHAGDTDHDRKEMRLNRFGIETLRRLVQDHAIDCQWSERGKIHAGLEAKGMRDLEAYIAGLDRLGEAYTRLDAADLKRILGIDYYTAGVHTPGNILMQPAALTRGLGGSLPDNVRLCEDSPVTAIDYGASVTLDCAGGRVVTDKLLLATNAFATQFGFLKGRILPVATYGSLTRPLSGSEAQALGGEGDWGVIPAEHLGTTLRYTQDRRILIRNTFAYVPSMAAREVGMAGIRRRHVSAFEARFPMLPEVTFEHSWGGTCCLSRNNAQFFGKLGDNIWAAVCQNAVGIARGTYSGMLLADLAVGQDSEMLSDLMAFPRPCWNPPEPMLGIGVRASIAWQQWRAGVER